MGMDVRQHRRLCMGCMREKGAAEICPACSWREGTLPNSLLELVPGTVINGVYMVGRVLGEGGFGITYIGWDIANGRRVAVKEFFPRTAATRTSGSSLVTPLSPQSAEAYEYGLSRFSEESRVLTMFRDHPCIVSCLDFQSANGTAYLVMEYLEGKTLAAYLREKSGRIGGEAALNVTMRVLDGLREVHEHGLLHRDISPDNIFLTRAAGVKLLDFGAARFAIGERSQSLSIIFKQGYAPPEQYLSCSRQGPQTDLYAAAATLYKSVTGEIPPPSIERQTHDTLEPPSRLGVALPPKVEDALMRALSLEMRDRFKTAKDFQEALCGRGGAEIAPDPPPQRRGKRKPNVFVAYAVGTLLGAALYLPLFLPGRFGLFGRPAEPPHASPPPATSSAQPAAPPKQDPPKLQVNYGTFQARLSNGRIESEVVFQILPFQGRHGCAVLVLSDEDGSYIKDPPGKTFELLRDFTTNNDQDAVTVRFQGDAPAAVTTTPYRKLSAQTVLFANPCDVENDPFISKSVVIPLVRE